MKIDEIIDVIKKRGLFKSIKRFKYLPYNMETAISVVEAIGRSRDSKFVIDKDNRFVYENMIRWIHGDSEMKCIDPNTLKVVAGNLNSGIYIAGGTGTGKSWVLEIMSAYCLIDDVRIEIDGKARCLHWQNYRTDSICDEYTATGAFEQYKTVPILGIQDFGSEPIESMFMGNRLSVMRQLLEYRGDQTDKVTLITSNLPISSKGLSNMYGDRVLSRFSEMCSNYFEIRGKDRRKYIK